MTSGPSYRLTADAPTSCPVLWDAPRHDWLRWIALSSNAGPGSLGRSVGEVVGGEVHATAMHDEAGDKRG